MERNEEQLRRPAARRVATRGSFVLHAVTYAIVNTGLVFLWAMTGTGYPWFVWPLFGWGIGVVAHAVRVFAGPDHPKDAQART